MMPTHSATRVTRTCAIAKTDARFPSETLPCTHKDEVAPSDLRLMIPGDTSSLPAELGTRQVTTYSADKVASQAAGAGKRSARTPVKQTMNVRPRARARTEEWSDSQSDRVDGVSGGTSVVTSGQSSEASSRVVLGTRSGRVLKCASMSGEGTHRNRSRSLPACGLTKCGSTAGWALGGEGPCEDCGGGVIHTGEDFLCAACHRTSPRWYHLGPNLRDDAIAWVQDCRAAGAGLPTVVVKSFVPSGACLCSSGDCFFANLRKYREKSQQRACIPCGTNKSGRWRNGGERARQYQLYFTGEGVDRTDRGMRKTKEVITAASDICNACHMAFYGFMNSTTRLPTTKELLAAPAGAQLSKGIARANIAVVRHVYEALAAGHVVCSEDIAVVLARERRLNEVKGVSDRHLREIVRTLMKEIGEGVGDVCVREYGGGTFGEDGRTTLVYLFPTDSNVDVLAATDRKLRRLRRENQELRQQLQEARGNGGSGSGSATATPQMHDERVEAAKIGGMVVREDILAARDLRNVRRGSTCEDDTERQLVPTKEYLRQLPESLRVLMANAFGVDMGFRDDTAGKEEGLPATNSRTSAQDAISQKNENKAYFLTMCLNDLLKDDSKPSSV